MQVVQAWADAIGRAVKPMFDALAAAKVRR
jgi:hypothetical protein